VRTGQSGARLAASRWAVAVWSRLRGGIWTVVQAAAAATIAYSAAEILLGHQRPFFAPVAAVVALGVSAGHRGRRAAEIILGVALGLIAADLIAIGLGTGPLRMGLVVGLAVGAALVAGGGVLLVNQAAVSALLVVTLQADSADFDFTRLIDATVGASVAFGINWLFPHDAVKMVARTGASFFAQTSRVTRSVGVSLEHADLGAAQDALIEAEQLEGPARDFIEASRASNELKAFRSPGSWGRQSRTQAAERTDLVLADVRVLARGAANLVRHGSRDIDGVTTAVFELAEAADALAGSLAEDGPDAAGVTELALRAARSATGSVRTGSSLAAGMLAGQVRMTAVDLVAASGIRHETAVAMIEDAAGRAVDLEMPQPN
jgi:uncharacterized membrane protein YgaE (UPF0421/DUF939 family)